MASFSQEQVDSLFKAVLIHDDLYEDSAFPPSVSLEYAPAQLREVYDICHQLWRTGADQTALAQIMKALSRVPELTPEDQIVLKQIRARYKHLHFAFIMCDARHAYPTVFHWITGILGELQDVLRNKKPGAARFYAWVMRAFLSALPSHKIARELHHFQPSCTADFKAFVHTQMNEVRSGIMQPEVTGRSFHSLRKVVSRHVCFYDTVSVLYPSHDHDKMVRAVSTVNGLMGSYHDGLIARRLNETQDYDRDRFAIPHDIKQRLSAMVDCHL